ncbi:MAG: hypothetical protein IKT56_04885 [Clostridia bacterium]|nr:hypothetical protein [Clostridia bacterium]
MVKIFIIFWAMIRIFSFSAEATDGLSPPYLDSGTDYEAEYDEFISGIPGEILPLLPEGLFSDDAEGRMSAAKELSDPKSFLRIIFDFFGFHIKYALGMFARLISYVILASLARAMFKGVERGALSEAFSLCISAAIIAAVIGEQAEMIRMVSMFIERLLVFVNSMTPLIGVLYAAGGNIGTAVAGVSSFSLFIAICENLCGITLIPVVGVCFAFSAAGAFSAQSGLGQISGAFKRIYTYGLGFLMSVMALVMGVQKHLTSKADILGSRAAKYAVSSFIPVVGATVGDSLRTVAASIEYIRGAVGGAAIVIILLLLLPTLISVALARCSVNIASTVANMLGCEKEGKLLSEIGNVYGYMIAVCSICSVMFIYALTLFVRCSAAASW